MQSFFSFVCLSSIKFKSFTNIHDLMSYDGKGIKFSKTKVFFRDDVVTMHTKLFCFDSRELANQFDE